MRPPRRRFVPAILGVVVAAWVPATATAQVPIVPLAPTPSPAPVVTPPPDRMLSPTPEATATATPTATASPRAGTERERGATDHGVGSIAAPAPAGVPAVPRPSPSGTAPAPATPVAPPASGRRRKGRKPQAHDRRHHPPRHARRHRAAPHPTSITPSATAASVGRSGAVPAPSDGVAPGQRPDGTLGLLLLILAGVVVATLPLAARFAWRVRESRRRWRAYGPY